MASNSSKNTPVEKVIQYEKKVENWFVKNSEKIFSFAGKTTVGLLIIWFFWLLLSGMSGLKGFQFDPFLAVLVLIGIILYTYMEIQKYELEKQKTDRLEKILEKLSEQIKPAKPVVSSKKSRR